MAGDIVAAPFSEDNAWYRAQIVGVLGDEVDLYFVDYGDSLVISKERIRRLRYVGTLDFPSYSANAYTLIVSL